MDGVKGTGAESVPAECTRKFLTKKFGVNWDDFEDGGSMKQTTIFESRKQLDAGAVAPRTTSLTDFLTTAVSRPRLSSASSIDYGS